jgi:hypothetical protein
MYQIPGLLKYPKLFHAFSTRKDGNMANSILGNVVNFDEVLNNRRKFLANIGVDIDKSLCMWVMHGDEIIKVPEDSIGVSMKDYKKAVKVDGLMTNKKGIYLFVLVADCLPIIFYDPAKEVISLVHAGWKGINLEITKKAVREMIILYGSNPNNIVVGISPYAHKESYIKEDPDQKDDIRWKPFIEEAGENMCKIDLVGFCKKQLIDAGILSGNIYISSVDTVKDKRFFSHVRERKQPIEKQGRFACVVGIKN